MGFRFWVFGRFLELSGWVMGAILSMLWIVLSWFGFLFGVSGRISGLFRLGMEGGLVRILKNWYSYFYFLKNFG